MSKYAVFEYNRQISKTYPYKSQAFIHCYENKLVSNHTNTDFLIKGISIKEVKY